MRVIVGSAWVCAAAVAGCGGSGQSSSASPESPAGIWGFPNNTPVAIINSAGQAIFFTSNGEIFTGTAEMSGADLRMTVEGYPNWGSTFSDGSDHGTGELVGTVTTAGTLSASLTFTTDDGALITANWTLPYYPDESSSLADISPLAGFAVSGGPATAIFIDPTGGISSRTAANGCILSGAVSTADTAHNVYEVSYSYADCTGAWQGLNGVQFTGLAFNSTNDGALGNLAPLQLIMVVSGASATAKYGILSFLSIPGV